MKVKASREGRREATCGPRLAPKAAGDENLSQVDLEKMCVVMSLLLRGVIAGRSGVSSA